LPQQAHIPGLSGRKAFSICDYPVVLFLSAQQNRHGTPRQARSLQPTVSGFDRSSPIVDPSGSEQATAHLLANDWNGKTARNEDGERRVPGSKEA
jgi:hypothetical protein